jgi:hypothetical protein
VGDARVDEDVLRTEVVVTGGRHRGGRRVPVVRRKVVTAAWWRAGIWGVRGEVLRGVLRGVLEAFGRRPVVGFREGGRGRDGVEGSVQLAERRDERFAAGDAIREFQQRRAGQLRVGHAAKLRRDEHRTWHGNGKRLRDGIQQPGLPGDDGPGIVLLAEPDDQVAVDFAGAIVPAFAQPHGGPHVE